MSIQPIYLDYNATTPVDQRVMDTMLPYFTRKYGNASSHGHVFGWDAEEGVSIAREQVAELLGVRPSELTFTSGATEAINIGLLGFCRANRAKGNHIITCKTEHKAVLDTCMHLEKEGFSITCLEVDQNGNIDLSELVSAIREQTILVCLMYANNETGVIHPVKEISSITRKNGIVFMTDATQALGKINLDLQESGIDIATFSGHKIYGPKGVGALYVSKSVRSTLNPIHFGGGQEKGLRPGTLNVPGIVGLGKACEIIYQELDRECTHLNHMKTLMEEELRSIEEVRINGAGANRLPNTCNLSVDNIDGSKLIRSLNTMAISQGSACSSVTLKPSHVLKSMGLSDELALSSIRISLGRYTTEEEVMVAVRAIAQVVEQLKLSTS